MMPPFIVFPTNRIAHFVEVSLYLFYLAQQVKLSFDSGDAKEPRIYLIYSSNSAITTYPLSGAFSTLTIVPSLALIRWELG